MAINAKLKVPDMVLKILVLIELPHKHNYRLKVL